MTDLEYRLIKEAVKTEVLQEMGKASLQKTESLHQGVKKKQQAIFDYHFPNLRQADGRRYWRVKEAIIKLTNLCRFRSEEYGAWDSVVRTEVEAESAIASYEAICKMAAELIGETN